jgi:hypothetical protein
MPISKYNNDGTVDVYNTKTGEVRTGVYPQQLSTISPNLVAEYQKAQTPESTLARKEAEVKLQKIEAGGEEAPKPETERVVGQLEDIYFGKEGEESLAFGKSGLGGRLPGVTKKIERQVSPGEPGSATERLNTYLRTLESIRPQLAKAAGDSGNIAFQEQLQAGKGLPQPTDTPTEAIEIMQSARQKFGLERSEELDKLKQEITGDMPDLSIQANLPETPPELGPTGEFKNRTYLEKLFSLKGIKQYAKEAPKIAGKGVIATGQNIGDILTGDIESARQRSEQFKPQTERVKELDDAAREEIIAKLETVAGYQMLKGFLAPKLERAFGAKAPELTEDILRKGTEQAAKGKEVRNAAIKEAEGFGKKVSGNKIYSSIRQWADEAIPTSTDSEEKGIKTLLKKAERFYKGKNINPLTAKKRWDTAVTGFKTSGKAGDTIKSGYHMAIRDGIRSELERVAPGFEKGTAMIHEGLQEDKILSSIARSLERGKIVEGLKPTPSKAGEFAKKTGGKIVGGVATGTGLYALAKVLGLQFSGGAYVPD